MEKSMLQFSKCSVFGYQTILTASMPVNAELLTSFLKLWFINLCAFSFWQNKRVFFCPSSFRALLWLDNRSFSFLVPGRRSSVGKINFEQSMTFLIGIILKSKGSCNLMAFEDSCHSCSIAFSIWEYLILMFMFSEPSLILHFPLCSSPY